MTKEKLFEYLESFSNLEDGWDGPFSKTISQKTIDRAKKMLDETLDIYTWGLDNIDATPDADGSIYLFYYGYERGDNNYSGNEMNIEIGDDFYSIIFDANDKLIAQILDDTLTEEKSISVIKKYISEIGPPIE